MRTVFTMKKNIVSLVGVAVAASLFWAAKQTVHLHTETTIDAPPERVWQTLTNTASYPQWNPVIVRLEGNLQPGQTIEFENRGLEGRSMTFRPTILKADQYRELRWLGRLWLPRLFDGEHYFILTPTPDGKKTHLQHGENFKGLLVPFVRNWLNGEIKTGFTRINDALKTRAEDRT